MTVPSPNIIWKGAHPNNFTVGRPGGGLDGRETFHHVVGSADSAVLVFNNPNRGASAHFVVSGIPGVVYQCVNIKDTSWADGNWDSNLRSISVEHEGDWRFGFDNATVRENAAWLCAWLREQYGVNRAVRHREVSQVATACPADLPLEWIWNRASELIAQYSKPKEQPEWLRNRKANAGTVYAQVEGLRLINLNDPNQFADSRVFARNTSFEIGSKTSVGGVEYFITKSSTDANLPNGIRVSEVASTPWVAPQAPTPLPSTPNWWDSVIDDANKKMYVLRETLLVDLQTGRPVVDAKTGQEIKFAAGSVIDDVSAHTVISNKTYILTEYSYAKKIARGILASDLSLNPQSTPVGTPANPSTPDTNALFAEILAFLQNLVSGALSLIDKIKGVKK